METHVRDTKVTFAIERHGVPGLYEDVVERVEWAVKDQLDRWKQPRLTNGIVPHESEEE